MGREYPKIAAILQMMAGSSTSPLPTTNSGEGANGKAACISIMRKSGNHYEIVISSDQKCFSVFLFSRFEVIFSTSYLVHTPFKRNIHNIFI